MASKTRIHKLDDCDNSINSAEKLFLENVQKCKMYNPLLFNPVLDSDQSLFVMHINTRSLQHNFENLNDLLLQMNFQPDILCVSETKIKISSLINISLPGYEFFHVDSPTNAGGVAIYVSKQLQYDLIYDFNLDLLSCEDIWILMFSKKIVQKNI